jgi:GGDEF domain-containing protein
VAKGWLLALLETAPLKDAPAILAADFVTDGPRICDAVVRALAADEHLRSLEMGGPLEPLAARIADLAGAEGAARTAATVDLLRSVIWSALRAELADPDPDQLWELAERLAVVTETVRAAALRGVALRGPAGSPASEADWHAALAGEIENAQRSRSPLSLLIVELEDTGRILATEPAADASAVFGRFADAVRTAARSEDIVALEGEGRARIIAPGADGKAAQALCARVAGAVGDAAPWRGAPLRANIGLAVLGKDGDDAASLIEGAEQEMFAAAAGGIRIARRVLPPEGGYDGGD